METAGNCIFSHGAAPYGVREDGGVKTICLVQQVPTNRAEIFRGKPLDCTACGYMQPNIARRRAFQRSQLFSRR